MTQRVVIVHLGRSQGMGAMRRVSGLRDIFDAAGAEVFELRLRADYPSSVRDVSPRRIRAIAFSRTVPETLSWSLSTVMQELDRLNPDLIICETARAYAPEFSENWPVILDFVDRLSESYTARAQIADGLARRLSFRILALTMKSFERKPLPGAVRAIAVGWEDARVLGSTWVPMTVEEQIEPYNLQPQFDIVFFGNLAYPPNIEAVARLGSLWPRIVDKRPNTTLVLAGAKPANRVINLAADHGWTLLSDVLEMAPVLASARLGVVPLLRASGMQTKVLDAASIGLAQVVSPISASGFKPGLPVVIADSCGSFVDHVLDLLANDDERAKLGRLAKDHVRSEYSIEKWHTWAQDVLATCRRNPDG